GQSLPTYSSMVASVHRLQLVHSATSMIMFHFGMGLLAFLRSPDGAKRHPGRQPPHFASLNAGYSHFAGTRLAAFKLSLISRSFSIAAKVADMCSTRRSQTSICTSELAPASECVDFVCVRSGVSRLRQPPRSTDLPGSPIGSYTADDS